MALQMLDLTQGNLFACVAALVAKKTGRAAKIRPDRDDDMVITGKRHDFVVDYEVGFDDEGRIHGVDMTCAARCGFSADLSGPVTDRALFHADNAYYYPTSGSNAAAQDQHGVEHGVPRLWRTAGSSLPSVDRGDRLRPRQGPARRGGQFMPTDRNETPITSPSTTTS
jgi:hypothetical protein